MNQIMLFKRALLIEDDQSHAFLIKRALNEFCAEVVHLNSILAAKEKLSEYSPEIIVTDLNLPDSQKFDHVRDLAQKNIPILVLTSSTALSDAVQAMQMGARDYIVKNFDHSFREALGISLTRVAAAIELERQERKLRSEIESLKVAIENSQDALAVVTLQGEVSYSNSSFKNLIQQQWQANQNNILESFGADIQKSESLAQQLREKLQNLEAGAAWQTEITIKNNKDLAYELSLSIIGRETSKAVIWIRNISERKRRERVQREILSTTTHDLKGPLGTIFLCSEMLDEMVKNQPKIHEMVLRVGSVSRTAINLIDEMLSARRIEEGTYILKPVSCDIRGTIQEVVGDFKKIAISKSLELNLDLPNSQLNAKLDRLGFTRILSNLLSNACKYTNKGGKIWVSANSGSDDFRLIVRDNGTGMEPAEVQKLFAQFSRLDKHSQIDGTGIGLFIVKSIVSAHGGRIDVTSAPSKGTTFEIIFPHNPAVNDQGEIVALA